MVRKKPKKKGSSSAPPKTEPAATIQFHFPEPTPLKSPLIGFSNVSCTYPQIMLSDVDVQIDMGARILIVGSDQLGVSTLFRFLAGDVTFTEYDGDIEFRQKLVIGKYSQHSVDIMTTDETPVHYLLRLHPNQEACSNQQAVRAELGKFGLVSHNHLTPISKLSDIEKARVLFTSISISRPHILFLGNPTHHLDMESGNALLDAVDKFNGAVVLVSPIRSLCLRICKDKTRSIILRVDSGGRVKASHGSYEEYMDNSIAGSWL